MGKKIHNQRRLRLASALMASVLALTSCGAPVQPPQESGGIAPSAMEEAPVIDYIVPESRPGILVDRVGYRSDSRKIAVLRGEDLPDEFRLVDASSGEVVYTGALEDKGYNKALEEYNSYGDFTEFTQAGKYYIECDTYGRSYTFEIANELYDRVFADVMSVVKADTAGWKPEQETGTHSLHMERVNQLVILLLSYELYADVFEDGDGNLVPDILDCATQILSRVAALQDVKTGSTGGCEYAYAAALAKYSYLYQKYDAAYAKECLNLADKAWRFADKRTPGEVPEDDVYKLLAAAELYRATGQYQYHKVIYEYGEKKTSESAGREANTVSAGDSAGKREQSGAAGSVSGNQGEERQSSKQQSGERQIGEQQSSEQQTGEQQSSEQQTVKQQSSEQQTGEQQSSEQQTGERQSGEQQTGKQQSSEQQTGEQQSNEQQTGKQQSSEQQTGKQQSSEQQIGEQQTRERQSGEQQIRENQIGERQTGQGGDIQDGAAAGIDEDVEGGKSRQDYLAEVTYLSTKQKVDVELCAYFMKEIMQKAENISEKASVSNYMSVSSDPRDIDGLLWEMVLLSVVEYVITNHEYGQVIENQHHYLLGRNPQAYCYWQMNRGESGNQDQNESQNEGGQEPPAAAGLGDNPVRTAGYLLMLSEMLANGKV